MKTSEKKLFERKVVAFVDTDPKRPARIIEKMSEEFFIFEKIEPVLTESALRRFDLLLIHDAEAAIDDAIRKMHYHGLVLPVVAYRGDVIARRIVAAMRRGAFDYIVPPYAKSINERALLACAEGKIELEHTLCMGNIKVNIALLSHRERQVAFALACGFLHSEIGQMFSISTRTVEAHSAKIYKKLGARSRHDLISLKRLFR